MVLLLPYVSIFVCLVDGLLSVSCSFFSLCYVLFVDAFNPRKRGLARFARCGRFAAAAGPSGPQMPPLNTGVISVLQLHVPLHILPARMAGKNVWKCGGNRPGRVVPS